MGTTSVDRAARDKMAFLLRRFIVGSITNDDFVSEEPPLDDPAVAAVAARTWALYSDIWTHRMRGRHAASPELKREIARWIVFLYSSNEYRWPRRSWYDIYNWPLNLFTLGWWERRKDRLFDRYADAGDFRVWPFLTDGECQDALRHPRLLAGGARA